MKKLFSIFIVLTLAFMSTGCIKRDNMEDITIYTTNYPTEYITKRLYGDYSKVKSIYPDGVNINDYELTNKQIEDYSSADLFIFNGLSNEKNYVTRMREDNKNLKIIDTTLSMEYDDGVEELWLDPSNFLMMAQNIKTGFSEYIDSYYLNEQINDAYDKLDIEASNLDAEIKAVIQEGTSKTIVASDKLFKFLEKYGLTVYVLDENSDDYQKTLSTVKSMISNGEIQSIYVKSNEEVSDEINDLATENNLTIQRWHTLANITEVERSENKDYFSIMNDNLELLRYELYK